MTYFPALPLLATNHGDPTELQRRRGSPDYLRKILPGCQQMASVPKWHRNIAENFNRLSRVHERFSQTTDGRTIIQGGPKNGTVFLVRLNFIKY